MADLNDNIRSMVKDWRTGTIYHTCPECSHKRRKKKARCLSVTVQDDRAVFCCHNCEIRGVVFRDGGTHLSRAERTERQRLAEADIRLDTERRIRHARQLWKAALP